MGMEGLQWHWHCLERVRDTVHRLLGDVCSQAPVSKTHLTGLGGFYLTVIPASYRG